jgi:hypothetical protein
MAEISITTLKRDSGNRLQEIERQLSEYSDLTVERERLADALRALEASDIRAALSHLRRTWFHGQSGRRLGWGGARSLPLSLVPLAPRETAEGDESHQGDDQPNPEAPDDHDDDPGDDNDPAKRYPAVTTRPLSHTPLLRCFYRAATFRDP